MTGRLRIGLNIVTALAFALFLAYGDTSSWVEWFIWALVGLSIISGGRF